MLVSIRVRRGAVRLDYGLKILLKGEYVAVMDISKCVGCGKSVSLVASLGRSPYLQALGRIIDMRKCFGCGVCRAVCENGAITLVPREEIPALRREW
ncbi:MAG: hypothetical protein OD814_001227 [Candidatus Alkanophagales archaeon MCA70_species_1]|nr:hypothetical protein [Candidatus Alkanophaga volatiphilum]